MWRCWHNSWIWNIALQIPVWCCYFFAPPPRIISISIIMKWTRLVGPGYRPVTYNNTLSCYRECAKCKCVRSYYDNMYFLPRDPETPESFSEWHSYNKLHAYFRPLSQRNPPQRKTLNKRCCHRKTSACRLFIILLYVGLPTQSVTSVRSEPVRVRW